MVSGRQEPHTHFLPLLFVLTSLRSPLPSRINCSACGYSSKEDLDKMTQGHRHSHKNQARPLLRVSKSMCRFTNLSHWRACCLHTIAYNCFVGRGLVLGLTHRYLRMSLGVYIYYCIPWIPWEARKEFFEGTEDMRVAAFVCRCHLISAWNSFICHLQPRPTQWSPVYFRNHSVNLGSIRYTKSPWEKVGLGT